MQKRLLEPLTPSFVRERQSVLPSANPGSNLVDMHAINSKFRHFMLSEHRMPVVMALVFLPWIAVVLFTAGSWAALNLLGYAFLVSVVGYGIVSMALPASVRSQTMVLAPAAGILTISALTAFWLRLGFPLIWAPALWLVLMAAGGFCVWADRDQWSKATVAYGGSLIVLSALICAVHFLPSARNDAVLRRDGSFNWIYVDTQYFHSMAASIKSSDGPPRVPGTDTVELLYHFGPYTPAAVISRLTGLDLGDAYARVTRGASLWALVLSCFGLGTLLSLKATGEKFGGVMSVAGLFFYGSLLALFTDQFNSSGYVAGPVLFKIPEVDVLADGGPFSHFILGHSVLNGLIPITAIMGLCLAGREGNEAPNGRAIILLALAALAVPVHSAAALYCLGIVGILLFWGRLTAVRSWLLIVLMFGFFFAAWKVMGYSQGTDAVTTINNHMAWQWWTIAVWLIVGLGVRILGFSWISKPLTDPVSALVLVTVVGLLSFSLVLQLQLGAERYGIYFLQSILSVLAFSRLTRGFWRGDGRSKWIMEWLRLAKMILLLLIAIGLLIAIFTHAKHERTGTSHFGLKFSLCCFTLMLLTGASMLMKKNSRFSTIGSTILMGVLLFGFLAWVKPWLDYGMGREKRDITLTAGEVRGLNRLKDLTTFNERFATNKHIVDSLVAQRERSYSYATLAERPVLLEGYAYRGVADLPGFQTLLRDNDLMFTTTNPDTLRDISSAYHVRWLVARPGTDIALPKPLPSWLVEQQDSGDLKIYRIN